MSDSSPGRLRALFDWLTGATPPPSPVTPDTVAAVTVDRSRIGPYVVLRKLGEGGMGVVYEARDERLDRAVALKTMSSLGTDETARKRFWREARAAASVNHPNICQIYEIGEDGGELFIAMELLAGESLADRLQRGAMNVSESMPIALGMLAALTALHDRGIVHRDLKPSNVFLTAHGVKLLDFGLARPDREQTQGSASDLTRTGVVLGTPRYMAPEQITGQFVDARSDLFAMGAILFEMLAGRPAFTGRSVVDVLHATLHEQPPALSGPPVVAAIDRVIRRALSKQPADRQPSAEVLAAELRATGSSDSDATPVVAQALTRLLVMPFRVLRADSETDFLAFSLPDAIATSLSGVRSLVIRSSAAAARFASETLDLKALAADADVDRVVVGTILRAGDQLRVTAQLVEAPGGTLLESLTVQSSLGDLFHLQDDIARRVVEALSLPLGRGAASPSPDAPRNAEAYELYLRANEAARDYETLPRARDLYEQSLALDANFAPAWAQLGRCHRVIGKFLEPLPDSELRAEQAFRRALELNPRFSVAHKFYANLEAEIGQSQQALVRLVQQAIRHGNDPELFAGLVHACRYCGLFAESIAAHEEARRLDPGVPTSVAGTLLLAGETERLVDGTSLIAGGGDYGLRAIALGLAGRRAEARVALNGLREASRVPLFQSWVRLLTAWLDYRGDELLAGFTSLERLKIQSDPEAMFQEAWLLCDVGQHQAALPMLQRAIAKGYSAAPTLTNSHHFDQLRSDPAFQTLLAEAEVGRRRAREAFREAGGERLLGRVPQ